MAAHSDLLDHYALSERPRIKLVVTDLVSAIVMREQAVFVGGMSTLHFLASRGQDITRRPVNDIDLATTGPDVFNSQMIQHTFLIHHFHPRDGRIVLVHKTAALKVDVFPMSRPELYEDVGSPARMGDNPILLQRLPWRLAQTVWDLWVMPKYNKVDPKQLKDGLALFTIATPPERKEAEVIWQLIKPSEAPTLLAVLQFASSDAAQQNYGSDPWKTRTLYVCEQCSGHPQWPLAPMQEVLELLGYVEGK